MKAFIGISCRTVSKKSVEWVTRFASLNSVITVCHVETKPKSTMEKQ